MEIPYLLVTVESLADLRLGSLPMKELSQFKIVEEGRESAVQFLPMYVEQL